MRRELMRSLMAGSMLVGLSASASTFATLTIDGVYTDWDAIPALDTDAADNAGFVDFHVTKIANDGQYLYIYNSFHEAKSLGAFTALDVDSNTATGFDVFGLGLIGSEAGWQNAFPFTQDSANFNNGIGMSGDFFGSGAALLTPFADGFERELAISLDAVFNGSNAPVFADDVFDLLFWTDQGNGDVTATISYTLAVPEPATLGVFATAALVALRRRTQR